MINFISKIELIRNQERLFSAVAKGQSKEITRLKEQNKQLKEENKSLKKTLRSASPSSWIGSSWRILSVIILTGLAGALLLVCNVLFWAGRTTLDTQSYKEVSSQLIKDPQIGSAVALYTTRQIFQNNDVAGIISSALPPRAEFLAQPLESRLQDFTQSTITKVLATPKFQDKWIDVNVKVHDSIIKLANSPQGQDGVISLNEAYQALASNLKDTKLAFLADKQLPSSVGQITVLQSDKLRLIHILSSNLKTFKYLSLALILVFSGLAIWLARNRRRTVIVIGIVFGTLMLITLLGLRVGSVVLSSKASPDYQVAVKHAVDIVTRPLVIQSYSLLLLSLLAAAVAYLGGSSRTAVATRGKVQLALEGRAHQALFSSENSFTNWVGTNKHLLRLALLILLTIYALSVRLTPLTIIILAAVGLVLVILIEVLAAPTKKR